ncbi:MAG: hypothetical protein E7353_06545 [Clostridiales bacterium]|nr:hypothetical protein [Clostridiales bacterium]
MKKRLLTILIIALAFLCLGADKPRQRFELEFNCNGDIVRYLDAQVVADNHLIYEEIERRKINASINDKKREVLRLIEEGKSEKQAVLNCFPLITNVLNNAQEKLRKEPKDSRIIFNPDKETMFVLTCEENGLAVDEDEFYADIVYALFANKREITVKTKPTNAKVTLKDNERYLYKKASYSTSVASSSDNRKHNVKQALSAINGSVLKIGEILSFNTKTGIRSEENGYKSAKIILGNEYVDGVGGGVCQASTTLYNCALLAGLEVESVSSHSLLPSYVEPSFDAMVNMGSSDLVIKNNTSGPIFIKAYIKNDRAIVEIYGCKNEYEIRKKSVTTYKGKIPEDKKVYDNKYFIQDETLNCKRVSYSQPQIKSEGYLIYYKNGEKQREQKIREDNYNSKSGIIAYRVEKKDDALFFIFIFNIRS